MATERVEEQKEIGVRDLLTSVYNNILQKYPQVKLNLEKPLESLVADDGDYHDWGRRRQGWMIYENAAVVKIQSKKWLLALGTKVDGYAGSTFYCDLKAFPTSNELIIGSKYFEELKREMYSRPYFKDSLLVGGGFGGLLKVDPIEPEWTAFSAEIARRLGNKLDSLISTPPMVNLGYLKMVAFSAPLSWAVEATLKYKSEASEVVSRAIFDFLEDKSAPVKKS